MEKKRSRDWAHNGSTTKRRKRFTSEENGKTKSHHSSTSSEYSAVGNDWAELTGGKICEASAEQMQQRKVNINNEPHFDTPEGHLLIKFGDIIQNKCLNLKIIILFLLFLFPNFHYFFQNAE